MTSSSKVYTIIFLLLIGCSTYNFAFLINPSKKINISQGETLIPQSSSNVGNNIIINENDPVLTDKVNQTIEFIRRS